MLFIVDKRHYSHIDYRVGGGVRLLAFMYPFIFIFFFHLISKIAHERLRDFGFIVAVLMLRGFETLV